MTADCQAEESYRMYYLLFLFRQFMFISSLVIIVSGLGTASEAASLHLNWSDNSGNEDGFKIERMSVSGMFVEVARVGANVTTYTDSNLAADTAYCYAVRAFNNAGSSDATNAACGTTETNVGGTGSSGGTPNVASSPNFNSMLTLAKTSDSASTRASVLSNEIMIGGFVIEGTEPAVVLIRGRGPTMGGAPFFVSGVLTDPHLQLFSGSTSIAQNDNWHDDPQCDSQFACGGSAEILATGLDPCQPNPGQIAPPNGCGNESAILMILPPGAYTAFLKGIGRGVGVGLVEVFEIDGLANPSKLVNISTRAMVQKSDNRMIGGMIVTGSASKTVLIRARGPSMGSAPFFVPGVLSDPYLQLFSGSSLVAQNDNWQDNPQCDPQFGCGEASHIAATGLSPCEPNPGQPSEPANCNREATILIRLTPGAYTAVLGGIAGGTGVGLVEIFDLD
jgi:hypothetical protein